MTNIIEETKKQLEIYTKSLGYSDDIEKRFLDMYFKEAEHIVNMKKRCDKLEKFKRTFLGRTIESNTFDYETVEDLFSMSVNNVNKTFNIIFKGVA